MKVIKGILTLLLFAFGWPLTLVCLFFARHFNWADQLFEWVYGKNFHGMMACLISNAIITFLALVGLILWWIL